MITAWTRVAAVAMEESGSTRNIFLKYNSHYLLGGCLREREGEREESMAPRFLVGMVGKNEVQKGKFGFGYVGLGIPLNRPTGDMK